jgi:hypothetical protein
MTERTYTPGVCNLGDAEARRRNIAGWIGLVLTLLLSGFLFWEQLPAWWRLLLFFPATFGAMGFLQGAMHFCASFGMKGIFNMSNEVGKTGTIAQAEFRAKDLRTARLIILYSVLIGIVIALVEFFI